MGQPIPAQHPSVVLRSHFKLVRGLLAIAMVAVLALTATVVILANDDDQVSPATKAAPVTQSQPQAPAGTRYDGGPEEGTRGAISTPQVAPAGTRYDGGPEEGTRGATSTPQVAPAGTRYDGGPEEGTRGATSTPQVAPAGSRYDGGPEEGTRGPIIPQGPLSR